jgi:hypothetical protein
MAEGTFGSDCRELSFFWVRELHYYQKEKSSREVREAREASKTQFNTNSD